LQYVIRTKLGITKQKLEQEIAIAISRTDLSNTVRESLDHVRQIGNPAAHAMADASDPAMTILQVTRDEALYTLEVLELMFDELYTRPRKTAEMKKMLDARVLRKPERSD
jgi:hypothetical protein